MSSFYNSIFFISGVIMAVGLTNTWQIIVKVKQTGTNFTIHQTRQERLMNASKVWQSHKGGELNFSGFFLLLSCIIWLVSVEPRVQFYCSKGGRHKFCRQSWRSAISCMQWIPYRWVIFLLITLLNPSHVPIKYFPFGIGSSSPSNLVGPSFPNLSSV